MAARRETRVAETEYGFWLDRATDCTFTDCIAVSGGEAPGAGRLPEEAEAFLRSLPGGSEEGQADG